MTLRWRGGWLGVASMALAANLMAASDVISEDGKAASGAAVKAAFLLNFAKFTVWPDIATDAPIAFCIAGDDAIAAALVETVRGQNISGHALEVRRSPDSATWPACQLVFITAAQTGRFAGGLSALKTLPILTVSDGKGFSEAGGAIELFLADGRISFAINIDAVERARLRLSSRLLGLARIIRDRNVQ